MDSTHLPIGGKGYCWYKSPQTHSDLAFPRGRQSHCPASASELASETCGARGLAQVPQLCPLLSMWRILCCVSWAPARPLHGIPILASWPSQSGVRCMVYAFGMPTAQRMSPERCKQIALGLPDTSRVHVSVLWTYWCFNALRKVIQTWCILFQSSLESREQHPSMSTRADGQRPTCERWSF